MRTVHVIRESNANLLFACRSLDQKGGWTLALLYSAVGGLSTHMAASYHMRDSLLAYQRTFGSCTAAAAAVGTAPAVAFEVEAITGAAESAVEAGAVETAAPTATFAAFAACSNCFRLRR